MPVPPPAVAAPAPALKPAAAATARSKPITRLAAASAAPPATLPVAPVVPAGAPRVEFAATSYEVSGDEPAARIVVRRLDGTDGDVSFSWWTEGASARPDVDYASLGRRIEHIPAGTDKITVYVPIISNPLRNPLSRFYVALATRTRRLPPRRSRVPR